MSWHKEFGFAVQIVRLCAVCFHLYCHWMWTVDSSSPHMSHSVCARRELHSPNAFCEWTMALSQSVHPVHYPSMFTVVLSQYKMTPFQCIWPFINGILTGKQINVLFDVPHRRLYLFRKWLNISESLFPSSLLESDNVTRYSLFTFFCADDWRNQFIEELINFLSAAPVFLASFFAGIYKRPWAFTWTTIRD